MVWLNTSQALDVLVFHLFLIYKKIKNSVTIVLTNVYILYNIIFPQLSVHILIPIKECWFFGLFLLVNLG